MLTCLCVIAYLMVGWFLEVLLEEQEFAGDCPFAFLLFWPVILSLTGVFFGIYVFFWPITWLARK